MNQYMIDSIAAQQATLTQLARAATEPLGYGRDLSCITDCDPYLTLVDPSSLLALKQALLRRITTARGSVYDDPDYGLDVRQFLNHGTSTTQLQLLGNRLSGEVMKDDRVRSCNASITLVDARTLRITLEVNPQPNIGKTFALVFSVTSSQVLIDSIGQ